MSKEKIQITCPNCNTSYNVPAGALVSGRRALKCAVCSATFVVEQPNPQPVVEEPAIEDKEVQQAVEPDSQPDQPVTVDYDPEESAWDTDPDNDPILGESEDEVTEGSLSEALEDYESIDIDDLTFGTEDDDLDEFEENEDEEADLSEELTFDDEPDFEAESVDAIPQPQDAIAEKDPNKIDASDDSYTLDGRPASEVEEQYKARRTESAFEDDDSLDEIDFEDELQDTKSEDQIAHSPLASLLEAEQSRSDEMISGRYKTGRKQRSSFVKGDKGKAPEELSPSSGAIYFVLIILIGLGGVATNFFDLGDWRFDLVWSGAMILIGTLGFFMQNLSGIYIAGFFSIFYAFALFAGTHSQINRGEFDGILHLAVIFVLAFILSLTYALLIGRKSGHFVLKESLFQSILSFILGLLAILTAYWAHINSPSIAPLGKWLFLDWPISSYVWYKSVPLDLIFQAAAASGAIAVGISAHRVRNRMLILAKLAILFGVVIILLLFAPTMIGNLTFDFPV